ncbi:MAG TPA: cytochrome C oxidase subunit IV family protein [Vicinamibacterales bacterium]|nr:cytochrome C oxidase subunit IV family protein [Vicinamibacterales bacterium]
MSGHVVSPRLYYVVFGALIVLTAVTVGAAFIDLGRLNSIVALTIAVLKATLVVLFFMHVKYATRLTWVVVASGFVWMFILFALTLSDYMSRGLVNAAQ